MPFNPDAVPLFLQGDRITHVAPKRKPALPTRERAQVTSSPGVSKKKLQAEFNIKALLLCEKYAGSKKRWANPSCREADKLLYERVKELAAKLN